INIVTKSAEQTQGVYAQASVGNVLQDQVAARYGGQPAPNLYLRVYGQYTGRGDQLTDTGADANDASHMGRGGFRLDTELAGPDQFTLQGDIYRGTQDDQPGGLELLSGGNLLGRWSRTFSPAAGMSLQLYYDHTYFSLPYPADPPAPPFFSGFPASALTDTLDTYDGEFQHQFAWGQRQKLVWGLGLRLRHEVDHNLSIVRFEP